MRIEPIDQPQIQLLLGTIDRQGRRLSHLISDLLLLSSIEQKTSSKDFQPCCLNDLITDLSEEFSELAVAAEITLYGKVPDSLIHVLGHEQQLYRLVSNLIANAIHYTPANGSVTIELERRDRSALITIKDTGIGIPAAEQTRIFERFYRIESDRSRKTGGMGLGLAIAQAIVQHHQGIITVKSEVGTGSSFMIHLPIMRQSSREELNLRQRISHMS
jgi:two-component system, OmpR family, Ni(II)-sensor and/or redox sensor kinase NrsS